jgi:ribosomal protein L11 methyltransferase
MQNTFQYNFQHLAPGLDDILVAELSEAGFSGFENTADGLLAFAGEEELDEAALTEILERYRLQPEKTTIAAQNWNAVWESNFDPVQVDDFCIVRAHFHPPVTGMAHDIVITPKMSFGTGHHATTYMMMAAMRAIDVNGKTVCDFGTGTGVLAILAEKLGASNILAIDNDDWSIENAAENIANNGCRHIRLQKAFAMDAGSYDVVLANINLHVLLANMIALRESVVPGGLLLLSGILQENIGVMEEALAGHGFEKPAVFQKEKWVCMCTKRV